MPITYNYYKILGISMDSTPVEIKKAFRQKAKKYHPDLLPNEPKATEYFRVIHEAYELLMDAQQRYSYDLELQKLLEKEEKETIYEFIRTQQKTVSPRIVLYRYRQERDVKMSKPLYNALFILGSLVGVVFILSSIVNLFYSEGWIKLASLLFFPGLVLMVQGWHGITYKKPALPLPAWLNKWVFRFAFPFQATQKEAK